ncbi:MAG: hypothetical protein ACOZIN_15335 [Myxococcota bacterium]
MRRMVLAVVMCLWGCVETRSVGLNFGEAGEGLDGFLCKDGSGKLLLERLGDGGSARPASLVFDFVRLGGVPGCRSGQLIRWCAAHECVPIAQARACLTVELPSGGDERSSLRAALSEGLRSLEGQSVIGDAPDEFVIVRMVGTTQSCEALTPSAGGALPSFERSALVGCAYSCPVLLDRAEQEVYLGFETLTEQCEQGVNICADDQLHWQP